MIVSKYEDEHRMEEAEREKSAVAEVSKRLTASACPLLCVLSVLWGISVCLWTYGVIQAWTATQISKEHPKNLCGDAPVFFWIFFACFLSMQCILKVVSKSMSIRSIPPDT